NPDPHMRPPINQTSRRPNSTPRRTLSVPAKNRMHISLVKGTGRARVFAYEPFPR
ncbi:hypothetical protein A2U01_0064379, partial [Trifolium medium]|nr:hypothetical protein [Trifolium medium]